MSGILRRTVFRHRVNNTVVLGDWARVSTSLGLCLEPFGKFNSVSLNTGQQAYDPDDQIARVDDMEEIAVGREMFLIGGADTDGRALNGGALWFRTGYQEEQVANNTSVNPWILDTAGTITDDAVSVASMHFHPSAADEDCTVKDRDGHIIWSIRSKAAASGGGESFAVELVNFNPPVGIAGFVLSAVGSGKLRVYRNSIL